MLAKKTDKLRRGFHLVCSLLIGCLGRESVNFVGNSSRGCETRTRPMINFRMASWCTISEETCLGAQEKKISRTTSSIVAGRIKNDFCDMSEQMESSERVRDSTATCCFIT